MIKKLAMAFLLTSLGACVHTPDMAGSGCTQFRFEGERAVATACGMDLAARESVQCHTGQSIVLPAAGAFDTLYCR